MAAARHSFEFSKSRTLSMRQRRSADVIVVGGGVSGLQAAYDIQQAGLTCQVLEAQPVAGGSGLQSGHGKVHFSNQPRTRDLVTKLGLEVESEEFAACDLVDGSVSSQIFDTKNLDKEDTWSYQRIRDNLEGLCNNVDVNRPTQLLPNYGSMTLHELAVSQGATAAVRELVEYWTLSIFGLRSTGVSAISFLLHCKCAGGLSQVLSDLGYERDDAKIISSSTDLGEKLASRLQPDTVQTSQLVQRIDQTSGNKCVVTTQSGDIFQCTKVILTIPLLQYHNVEFVLKLSEDKQWLCNADKQCSCAGNEVACGHHFAVSTTHLRSLERDGWQPEGSIHFSGSETSCVWRGSIEGALASGSRTAEEVIGTLRPTHGVQFAKL